MAKEAVTNALGDASLPYDAIEAAVSLNGFRSMFVRSDREGVSGEGVRREWGGSEWGVREGGRKILIMLCKATVIPYQCYVFTEMYLINV